MPDAREVALAATEAGLRAKWPYIDIESGPEGDEAWMELVADALDALASSPEVREALVRALCPCGPNYVFHDLAVCKAHAVDAVLAALAGTSGTEEPCRSA